MGISNRLTPRKEKKISQGKLAEMVGIHSNILGRYERGGTTPNIVMATKLAKAMKVSLVFLVGVTDIELDKNIINKILPIQKLPEKDKEHIMYSFEGLIQHAKNRETYIK